jgi:hypothetical protein
MKAIVCIDPGASGAIAWRDGEGNVYATNMPPTYTEIADLLGQFRLTLKNPRCVIEKVGAYMPGNSGPAAAKFARHCGHLEQACYCLGLPTTQVPPQKWMKKLGALPKDKKDRKNKIKEMMAARYPHLSVTLKNADALGILTTELDGG